MDNQAAFDKMIQHCFDQGVQSRTVRPNWGGHAICAYRGTEGRACAVGCLIPDSEYDPAFEGEPVDDINCAALKGLDIRMLSEVQSLHDCHLPETEQCQGEVVEFLEGAIGAARTYRLDDSLPRKLLCLLGGDVR